MHVCRFAVNMSFGSYVIRNREYFFVFNGVMQSLPIRYDYVTVPGVQVR